MSSSLQSQTFYALQIDRNIRSEAEKITGEYQPYLVMGANQRLQFKSTVARFLVKKRAVAGDPKLSPREKYHLYKRLYVRETSEMADVLESYQWQAYLNVKQRIQPLPRALTWDDNLMADN
ncbi:Hypothetical protein I595_1604 [Croceitalea dokdonensis DOKDO 023]|uniref:Uncharacterized protein n=1 Tax=Croceitalea dokdonensis DOKDO 023 TaxID=1300341 RepID=A0A0N8H3Z6_9FLAO|nr:Hypothetical protein I595_1604 [Croceitalea dokdonensis DOKDO 023]